MGKQAYKPQRIIDGARKLLADAATRCHAPDRTSEDNVHEIRKDLKTVRSYWRLMRHPLGKRYSKAGNERCKQAARQLAAARDRVVMLGTLDEIGNDTGSKTAMAVGQAKQAMQEAVHYPPEQQIEWDNVADLIRNDDAAWSGLDPSAIDPADVKRSWKRTRKKARKYHKSSRKDPNAETLHAWRKWVKRRLKQEELLHPGKTKRIDRLDDLSDVLGLHHDFAVLSHRLWRNDHFGGKPQRSVRKSIGKRQRKLEKQALKLGRKLFA